MEIKKLTGRLLSVLLIVVILAADFNPADGKMNTKSFTENKTEYKFFDFGALKYTRLNIPIQATVNEIDKNRPFVMVLQYNNKYKARHASVCAGYNLETKQLTLVCMDAGIGITQSRYVNSSQPFVYFGDEVTCPYIAYTY